MQVLRGGVGEAGGGTERAANFYGANGLHGWGPSPSRAWLPTFRDTLFHRGAEKKGLYGLAVGHGSQGSLPAPLPAMGLIGKTLEEGWA